MRYVSATLRKTDSGFSDGAAPSLAKQDCRNRTLASDALWLALPVRGQRRRQPFGPARTEQRVFEASSSTSRPTAEVRRPRLPTAKQAVIGSEASHAGQRGPLWWQEPASRLDLPGLGVSMDGAQTIFTPHTAARVVSPLLDVRDGLMMAPSKLNPRAQCGCQALGLSASSRRSLTAA